MWDIKMFRRLFLMLLLSCGTVWVDVAVAQDESSVQLYTAYNMWHVYRKGKQMMCINYKHPDRKHDRNNILIPAGTPVNKVKVISEYDSVSSTTEKYLSFYLNGGDSEYRIRMEARFHPGENLEKYKEKMFTAQTFNDLVSDLSSNEIAAIKKGVVVEGMCKKAVVIAYGIPPQHVTPSLDADLWVYWLDSLRKKKICFDGNSKTVVCGDGKDEIEVVGKEL